MNVRTFLDVVRMAPLGTFREPRTDPAYRTSHFAAGQCEVPTRPRTDPACQFCGRMAPSPLLVTSGNAAGSSRGKEGDPRFNLLPSLAKQMVLKQRRTAAGKASTAKKARQADAAAAAADNDNGVLIIGPARAPPPQLLKIKRRTTGTRSQWAHFAAARSSRSLQSLLAWVRTPCPILRVRVLPARISCRRGQMSRQKVIHEHARVGLQGWANLP